jgi:predicted O-linked N-acetylglucosamine transferase (SPINDLY family)
VSRPSLEEARRRLAANDVAGARRQCEALLAGAEHSAAKAAVHLVLAECCRRSDDDAAAIAHVHEAIAGAPADPVARYALAELLDKAGAKDEAVASLRRAVEIEPRFAQGWNFLGILLGERGDAAGAALAFERTLELDPRRATAWNNLGNAQRTLGRLDDAAESFARALSVRADYPLAAANLATAQRDLGEWERAEATARAALARHAGGARYRPLVVILAGLLRERGAFDESAHLYAQAIEAAPGESAGEWISLARVLSERGDTQRAKEAYARAQAADPGDLRAPLGARLTLPLVYADAEALAEARRDYAHGVDSLILDFDRLVGPLSETQILDGLRWTNFFLAYQGRDDRALQAAYANFAARAVDKAAAHWRAPMAPRAPRERLRIGFASAFFHVGTVGRYFCNWMTELDRDRFELYVYHLFPGLDEVAAAIEKRADRFRTYGGSRCRPTVVAPDIRADELDVLIYPELGMDVTAFALAALRLAPRQYSAWGHPVTTGHPTIDGYFTCAAMEPDGCEAHYTEPLIKLPGIGTRYVRPTVPPYVERSRMGLPDDKRLLLCPQSLFKIHPDNDEIFARVLAENADALLIVFAGRHPAITDQYMRRLARACERHGLDVRARTRVLPSLPHSEFLAVNRACDAMLDTLHWSGGNTSLDALACAVPIVTLPGAYMRGRQSAGMLALLGVPELIAGDPEEYVRIATRLVREPAWRRALSERIAAAQDRLFGASDAIEVMQAFLHA